MRLFLALRFYLWLGLLSGLSCATLSARAGGGFGGGGGGHSGGGGFHSSGGSFHSSGGGGRLVFSGDLDMIWLIIIIVFIAISVYQKFQQMERSQFVTPTRPLKDDQAAALKILRELCQRDPTFTRNGFFKKAEQAFLDIQRAWSDQDMGSVRRFLSDGVYQRFKTQIEMMRMQGHVNRLSNVSVISREVVGAEMEGEYEVLHVWFRANLMDELLRLRTGSVIRSGQDTFAEYWTFIRRKNSKKRNDMYSGNNCPSCGGPLENLGELAQCPHCKSLVNTGEYDWVLSEITQREDWRPITHDEGNQLVAPIQAEDQDFNRQVFEDRVSNGFMQMLYATAKRRPELARRFVSDEVFAAIKAEVAELKQQRCLRVHEALFINTVETLDVNRIGDHWQIQALVRYSHRVTMLDDQTEALVSRASSLILQTLYLVLERRCGVASRLDGGIYSLQCPNCGGRLEAEQPARCNTCGAILNSGDYDWVIQAVSSTPRGVARRIPQGGIAPTVSLETNDPRQSRAILVRNLCVLLGADGVLTKEEAAFLTKVNRRFGLKNNLITHWLRLAIHKRLTLALPDAPEARRETLQLLVEGALADHAIQPQEEAILDKISKEIGEDWQTQVTGKR